MEMGLLSSDRKKLQKISQSLDPIQQAFCQHFLVLFVFVRPFFLSVWLGMYSSQEHLNQQTSQLDLKKYFISKTTRYNLNGNSQLRLTLFTLCKCLEVDFQLAYFFGQIVAFHQFIILKAYIYIHVKCK